MAKKTRSISWIKAARKDFEDFPAPVQMDAIRALTVVAEGRMADHVKPLKGFDKVLWKLSCVTVATLFALFMPSKSVKNYGLFTPFRRNQRKALKHRNMK